MSHKPPLPDAAVSPYPAHPAPTPHSTPDTTISPDGEADRSAGASISARSIGVAAGAAAIGSAAIAAALIFYNRGGSVKAATVKGTGAPKKQERSRRGSKAGK